MTLTSDEQEKVMGVLESMHKMMQSEDWSECRAQEMVSYGSELYEKITKNNKDEHKK